MEIILPEKRYYSIGEVASAFKVSQSKLRYWETEFKEIAPKKKKNGIRKYTSENIEAIKQILYLREEKKLTIHGTRIALSSDSSSSQREKILERLKSIRQDLIDLHKSL